MRFRIFQILLIILNLFSIRIKPSLTERVECNTTNNFIGKPKVHLLEQKGFSIVISDARDIRQLHIFWNFRKPYNRSNPYSTTDFSNVAFNENFDRTITVSDTETHLRVGDSIFYWLLLVTREWERITLHKQNFWVRFDQSTWTTVAEPFAETYYRDFENFYTKDEI